MSVQISSGERLGSRQFSVFILDVGETSAGSEREAACLNQWMMLMLSLLVGQSRPHIVELPD